LKTKNGPDIDHSRRPNEHVGHPSEAAYGHPASAGRLDGANRGFYSGTGTIHVHVKGKTAAEGKIGKTVRFIFSADETLDVVGDLALPVPRDYPEGESS
jgi:hypothetical protein